MAISKLSLVMASVASMIPSSSARPTKAGKLIPVDRELEAPKAKNAGAMKKNVARKHNKKKRGY